MRFRLTKLISASFVALLLLLFIALSSYQIFREISNFQYTAKRMRSDFINQQKSLIKREVERAVSDIQYELKSMDMKLQGILRTTVTRAQIKFSSIWEKYQGKKSKAEIMRLAKDVLAPVPSFNKKNFYFIFDSKGRVLLNTAPAKLLSPSERRILSTESQRLAAALQSEQNELFFHGNTFFPNNSQLTRGYVYARAIKPLNLYIASYEEIDDIEHMIQEDMLDKIAHIRFGREGYIFVNTFDGTALLSNGRRNTDAKKLWEAFGEKVRPIFEMEMKAAQKPQGDFIYYRWKKLSSDSLSPKASFIMGIPKWQWIVGAGVYLDDVEKDITALQQQLRAEVKKNIYVNIGILLFILLIFLVIRYFLMDIFDKEFELFLSFFRSAAHKNQKIDISKIKSREFYELAQDANKMLEDKHTIEKKLLDEKEYLSVTLRSIADSVITTDTEGKITSINPVAEKLTGYSSEQAIGKPLMEVFTIYDSETGAATGNPVKELLHTRHVVFLGNNVILRSRSGTEYHIEDSAAPIRNARGEIIGAVIVFRDVTEKLKNEQEIQKIKKLESIGILAGGIAHDFNNLLTGISGNLSLMELQIAADNKLQKYLQSAKKAVARATNLTGQLLTFSKGGEPIKENVKIGHLVEEVAHFNLRGSNIKLHFNASRSLWEALVDKNQLSQVIDNLVINAKQAMPQGGNLYITLNNLHNKHGKIQIPAEYCIRIRIKDEGPGIPEKILDKIFDPYFTTKQTGSGLGLSTVFSIIKRHGGHIEVKSKMGRGTTFTLYLPAVVRAGERAQKATRGRPSAKAAKPHSLRVLVMDDDEMIRTVSADILRTLGYSVDFASDGREAMASYQQAQSDNRPFDVVIMDLTIPGGMGGKEAIGRLLAIDPLAKVLVASGYSNDPVLSNYTEYGFVGRIVKPFRLEEVKQTIESLFA